MCIYDIIALCSYCRAPVYDYIVLIKRDFCVYFSWGFALVPHHLYHPPPPPPQPEKAPLLWSPDNSNYRISNILLFFFKGFPIVKFYTLYFEPLLEIFNWSLGIRIRGITLTCTIMVHAEVLNHETCHSGSFFALFEFWHSMQPFWNVAFRCIWYGLASWR